MSSKYLAIVVRSIETQKKNQAQLVKWSTITHRF